MVCWHAASEAIASRAIGAFDPALTLKAVRVFIFAITGSATFSVSSGWVAEIGRASCRERV